MVGNTRRGEVNELLTKLIKWSGIVALIAGGFLRSFSSYALLSQFVIATAAAVVLTQAARMRRYVWMTLFLVVVCLFNPVLPVPFSSYILGIVSALAVLLFFFSLELLQPKQRLSIASITDRMPGSESL
jgi:flagellar biosynthesis protein FlhB